MVAPALTPTVPRTHPAVAIVAPRAPLGIIEAPTEAPGPGEVLIHVLWTSSTPLDLHQADGGLLVQPPYVMGGSFAGEVAQVGSETSGRLAVGDEVFGYNFGAQRNMGHQTYLVNPEYVVSKLPPGLSLPQAVSVPCNLVTAFHTITADLLLPLPWPVPQQQQQQKKDGDGDGDGNGPAILVWGASSSVGNYVIQVLRHWGYRNILAVASGKHRDHLRGLGAKKIFDYTTGDVVGEIQAHARGLPASSDGGPRIPYIVDCIGSLEGTLRPLSRVAEPGARVAVMLPVINTHASDDEPPEYEMDISKVLPKEWKNGVILLGTRTHFYQQVRMKPPVFSLPKAVSPTAQRL